MKRLISIVFVMCVLYIPIIVCAEHYVSNPKGALAFSSVSAFDQAVTCHVNHDMVRMSELFSSGKVMIIAPGTPVKVESKTKLAYGVTIPGSSKIYAVQSADVGETDAGK